MDNHLACICCGKTEKLHLKGNKREGKVVAFICFCSDCKRHSFYVELDRIRLKYYGEPDRTELLLISGGR